MRIIVGLSLFALSIAAFAQAPAAPPAPAPAPAAPPAPPATVPTGGAKTYKLDAGSALLVRTWKDGAAARLAHDHAVRASEFSGEATWDPAAPETLKLQATVQTKTLIVDEDADRRAVGIEFTEPVAPKDKKAVEESMKDPGQLDVKRFPTISFKSTKVDNKDGKLTLHGDLTLHGVTKSVKMPIEISEKDGKLVGTTSFKLKVSDYGITPYSAYLGAVKVKDEVQFHLKLVGVPK